MQCLLDESGLSIGMVSLPFQRESEFYRAEIEPIFGAYKRAVRGFFPAAARPSAHYRRLYEPRPYYLFGRFDLAVLYLVDDHDFSCRTFRPFHPKSPAGLTGYPGNFNYKVLFGPTPRFSTERDKGIGPFLNRIGQQPLIAITQVKINNSLLLGGGATFLRLIVNFIKSRARQTLKRNLIILESYGWQEITLVMLGSSYRPMIDFIGNLRETTYGDLCEEVHRVRDSELNLQLSDLKHLVASDTSLDRREIRGVPLFGNLTTNLGFDFGIFEQPALIDSIGESDSDTVRLMSRWFVKPGRMADFGGLLLEPTDSLMCSIGRGDVCYGAADVAPSRPLPTRAAIRQYMEQNTIVDLNKVALQRYTLAALSVKPPRRRRAGKAFSPNLRRLIFARKDLDALDEAMRKLRIPKVLIHRLLNIYGSFNDGVLDRSLYPSFMELRPFLVEMATELRNEAASPKQSLQQVCRTLRKWSENFERAYRNRFHNSEQMGEVTDFNFEFKGGIQQVVTAFDAAYKALASTLGAPASFVSVGGDPGVESSAWEVRLNYFHVFQPEMFFAVAGKEASNWFATKRPELLGDQIYELIRVNHPPAIAARAEHLLRARFRSVLDHTTIDDEVREVAERWITKRFLQTHFAELLTSQACYAGKWDLFCHWTLGVFLQMAGNYSRSGRLKHEVVALFLFRLRMIAGDEGSRALGRSIRAFGDPEILGVYNGLASSAQLEILYKRVMSDPFLGAWFRFAREVSEDVARAALADGSRLRSLDALQSLAQEEAAKKRSLIARGHVPRFEHDDQTSAFRFCQHVLSGYLELLKRRWKGNPRLIRGAKGLPRMRVMTAPGASPVLFDPQGGVFAHEERTRRKLFQYRSAVTMSMWDLGMKMKRDVIGARMS
jgi:hypothetical protein